MNTYREIYWRYIRPVFILHALTYPYRARSSCPSSPLRRILTLELLLRRRRLRDSAGSAGLSPLARAYRFRTSVNVTTPTSPPDSRLPGRADAGIGACVSVHTWEAAAGAPIGEVGREEGDEKRALLELELVGR